jgi:hypothetical protein
MKINQHFDNNRKTLKVSFEPDLFSEEDLELAKQDLLEAGARENDLNQEIDEVIFENSYLDDCENCTDEEEIYGTEEELNEDNFYAPEESEYVTKEEMELEESEINAAEYKGRKVKLNKPFRTPGGPKKFAVYTKNESGKVVIVRFGDPDLSIKKHIPERRKSFRARHGCDTDPRAKDKTTRKYWSCRQW